MIKKFSTTCDNEVYTVLCINKGRIRSNKPHHYYCGRGSCLGNPYKMDGEKDRSKVCDNYEQLFYEKIRKECNGILDEIFDDLLANKTVWLSCYCVPKRCHTETIANYLIERIRDYFL